MRAISYTTVSLLLVACLAAADGRHLQNDGPGHTYVRDRTFATIVQHKQPNMPNMPIKEFEKRQPAGRFASGAVIAGRKLLNDGPGNTYVRDGTFLNIAQHKQPNLPNMPFKEFEKRQPAGRFASGSGTAGKL